MQIQDLFRQLSHQELAHLSIGMEGAGTITESHQPRVLSITNSALLDLHTRFILSRGEELITTIPGQYSYQLAAANVIRVLEVYRFDDEATLEKNEAHLYGINRVGPETGVRVDNDNVIRFRFDPEEQDLRVEYQAQHPTLEAGAPLETEIDIEPYLHEALRVRVAASIFQSMSGEAHVARAAQLKSQFEEICARLDGRDIMSQTEHTEFDALRDKGFR